MGTVEVGFYVNMHLKICIICDHREKKEIKMIKINEDWKIILKLLLVL